jgi:galactitol-specific phosphotransferase system IIB component
VAAAGGLLSLSSSVCGTGLSSSTVSMSSESAFVPDASGAVTVRSVAVSSSSGSLSGLPFFLTFSGSWSYVGSGYLC